MTTAALSVEPFAHPVGGEEDRWRASRRRIALCYWWQHGRRPDLGSPRLFTELLQTRKLHDRDARMPLLADKVAVKQVVADRLGAEWVIPTLWHGAILPTARRWPLPLVVKARHGCGQHVFVRDAGQDWAGIGRRADRWTRRAYGGWLDEWAYRAIPRGLLVEPFMGREGVLPLDYKFFVFGGRVEAVQVHLAREHAHRWMLFDRDWRPFSRTAEDVSRPRALPAMIAGAEEMARGFDFVRVDLYEIAGRPTFGEMTFYPGSGLLPIDPIGLDARFGELWLAARNRRARSVNFDQARKSKG